MLVVLCSAQLVACSSSGKPVSLNQGSIFLGNDILNVDEFKGYEASKSTPVYDAKFTYCADMDACPSNNLGILEENMDKHKKATYYTKYHKTELVLHYPKGDGFTEVVVKTKEGSTTTADTTLLEMYDLAAKLDLSAEYNTLTFNDCVALNVAGSDFRANAKEKVAVLPGAVKVSLNPIPKGASSAMVGETTVKKVSTDKYDYYEYNGVSIQATKGMDITSYITFK